MDLRGYQDVDLRRKALEKEVKAKLFHVGNYSLDVKLASTKNCENMIGAVQIPLGVAGPLRIQSSLQKREVYVPMSTTEGALVASVNRGAKALSESDGVLVESEYVGATRGPVFRIENLQKRQELLKFLDAKFTDLQKVAASTSNHLKLLSYETSGVGRYQYVRFYFDTQDAMGLNMITIATDAVAKYIKKAVGIDCISLSGNFCVDKKPAWQNFINKRGRIVRAEAIIKKSVLEQTLKTTAFAAYQVWLAKCLLGGVMAGSMGYNAHAANVIAAIFIATGQDPAHVVEGSLAMTTAEIVNKNDLYVNVYIPGLMVGTIGGGTVLATQNEALSIMGVAGGNRGKNAQKFSEIIASAVLAGEISLLSSLEQQTLAQAHKKLGRGEKI